MTITVKQILGVEEKAFQNYDRTHFETDDGLDLYTFTKVFAGQSYDGFIKTDKEGRNIFKKAPKPDQQQFNTPQTTIPVATAPPAQFIEAVDKFATSVDKLEIAVEALSKMTGTQTIPPQKLDDKSIEEFFETENA